MLLAAVLVVSFFSGVLYDLWSLRMSARRSSARYHWSDGGVVFDDAAKRESISSAVREVPLFVAGLVGVCGLVLRPEWLVSSGLTTLCAVAVLFSAGMVVSGSVRAIQRFAARPGSED